MTPRAIVAVAVWTAALTGPAFAQVPAPAPAGFANVSDAAPAWNPNVAMNPYAGGPQQAQYATPADAGMYGSVLPTDGLTDSALGAARGPKAWVGAEYLLFWTKDAPLPVPIASAGPANGLGILGTPGTKVVVGNSSYDYGNFNGIRVNGGYWFTDNNSIGMEGSFFILPEKKASTPLVTGVPGLPTLARPFYDTALSRQNSRLLTRPNTFVGGISTEASSELWGAELSAVYRCLDRGSWFTADIISGFKFLSLRESLTINDFATAQAFGTVNFNGQQFANGVTYLQDKYSTSNQFYGWLIGGRQSAHYNAFTFGVAEKVGIGTMNQQIKLDGSSTLAGPYPAPQTTGGAFFTTGFNSGSYTQNSFAATFEVATNLNIQVTECLSFNLGYNFLYVTDVVRPGNQLSTNINSARIPIGQNYGANFGQVSSGVPFNTSSYYAQGLNFGVACGY